MQRLVPLTLLSLAAGSAGIRPRFAGGPATQGSGAGVTRVVQELPAEQPSTLSLSSAHTFRLPGGVVTGGVVLRGVGTGSIDIGSIPAHSEIQAAFLYWGVLLETEMSMSTGTLNGVSIVGNLIGSSASPCWNPALHCSYRADVTPHIRGNDAYTVSFSDSGDLDTAPSVEGASLVVIYRNPLSAYTEVQIMEGNDLLLTQGTSASNSMVLAGPLPLDSAVVATFIVSDGQTPGGDTLSVNGSAVGGENVFQSFWETKAFDISSLVSASSPDITSVMENAGDCLVWVATVVEATLGPCEKVPLGGTLTSTRDPGYFRIYVPTQGSGTLSVRTDAGNINQLSTPAGVAFVSGEATPPNRHGWYSFEVNGSTSYTVRNIFAQSGDSDNVPWNFWFYPFRESPLLNLFDNPGPCTRYDAALGLGTLSYDWEYVNHQDASAGAWWGHCAGATVASILLQQPSAAPSSGLTQDDLEGMAAEFFDKDPLYKTLAVFGEKATGQRASSSDTDAVDPLVHLFHDTLYTMLSVKRRPLLIDLRQSTGIGAAAEVWNQACYRYEARMREAPAAAGHRDLDAPRQIEVVNSFVCNHDFLSPGGVSTGQPHPGADERREQQAVYTLIYGADGEVMPNGEIAGVKQNWTSMQVTHVGGALFPPPYEVYVPWIMCDVSASATKFVDSSSVSGYNPHVTGQRLIELGLQKNVGY